MKLTDQVNSLNAQLKQQQIINAAQREELNAVKAKLEEITKDKRWLQQICQQQSSAIASYMGSR